MVQNKIRYCKVVIIITLTWCANNKDYYVICGGQPQTGLPYSPSSKFDRQAGPSSKFDRQAGVDS